VTGQRITSDSSIKPRLRNTIRPGSMKIGLDCWMSVTGVELRRSKESWRKICVLTWLTSGRSGGEMVLG
jgi:hypothetical protein